MYPPILYVFFSLILEPWTPVRDSWLSENCCQLSWWSIITINKCIWKKTKSMMKWNDDIAELEKWQVSFWEINRHTDMWVEKYSISIRRTVRLQYMGIFMCLKANVSSVSTVCVLCCSDWWLMIEDKKTPFFSLSSVEVFLQD